MWLKKEGARFPLAGEEGCRPALHPWRALRYKNGQVYTS